MEVRFVTKALRNRWWVVVGFALLGLVAANSVGGTGTPEFEAKSLVLVQAPSGTLSPAAASQPDRYVLGQISLLESSPMASSVAVRLGGDETTLTVARSTTFEQRAETDIVEITATTSDADRSQRIAQTYADVYVDGVQARADAVFAPERERLIAERVTVSEELEAVNQKVADAAAPFLRTLTQDNPVQVPDIRVLDPSSATQQDVLTSELQRIDDQLNQLELAAGQAVSTEIIQEATVPEAPIAQSSSLIKVAAFVMLTALGIVAALLLGRFSRNVVDDLEIEEKMRQPIDGRMPKVRALSDDPVSALQLDDGHYRTELERLAARIEVATAGRGSRIIAVGGSRIGAGSTTLAIALAAQFAERGNRTILIDADFTSGDLTRMMGAPERLQTIDFTNQNARDYGRTSIPNLVTLGTETGKQTTRIDRNAMGSRLRKAADVVVIDVGPVLSSTAASQLADEVDAFALCFPSKNQRTSGVDQVSRTYESMIDRVIPVICDTPRRHSKATTGHPPAELTTANGELGVANRAS